MEKQCSETFGKKKKNYFYSQKAEFAILFLVEEWDPGIRYASAHKAAVPLLQYMGTIPIGTKY